MSSRTSFRWGKYQNLVLDTSFNRKVIIVMNEVFYSFHFPYQVRISQKYQLSLYVQKCDEVLDYLHKGAGHNFLQQQSWVGDEGGVAEELLNQQNEFENVFQVCLYFFQTVGNIPSVLLEPKVWPNSGSNSYNFSSFYFSGDVFESKEVTRCRQPVGRIQRM